MTTRLVNICEPPPYFAELPYYLWGATNYDSDGNCRRPTDREWTALSLRRRGTQEAIEVTRTVDGRWSIEGEDRAIARTAMLLLHRCDWEPDAALVASAGDWDHAGAIARAELVRREFEQPALAPFDNKFFWGSWKWVGGLATDCTWVGRWIMHSVVRGDTRAIPLCIDWLKEVRFPEQAAALCYAVARLSGESARDPAKWVRWYEGSWGFPGAKKRFPTPDMDAWLAEMDGEFGSVK